MSFLYGVCVRHGLSHIATEWYARVSLCRVFVVGNGIVSYVLLYIFASGETHQKSPMIPLKQKNYNFFLPFWRFLFAACFRV